MTEALSTLFEGHEIRVLEQDNDLWFPLTDIAKAWGIDRKTPANLIDRNKELFRGMFRSDGDVTYHDVNERGLYLLMGKISADRLKNPDAKTAMIRFQRWVPELIQQYRKKAIVQIQEPSINRELLQASEYAEACNQDPAAFQAAVFRKHNLKEFADIVQPALVHGEVARWYNVTQLCEMCHDEALAGHPERLNAYLKNHGYQYRERGLWRLQPSGESHGKEYWYEAPSGHREIRIRWRVSILYASGLLHEVV